MLGVGNKSPGSRAVAFRIDKEHPRIADAKLDLVRPEHLDDRDGHGTVALLYQLRSKYGAWWVVAEQVALFLHHVGEEWANGTRTVIEEHIISERLLRSIASIGQALPIGANSPVCLFVMVEGDDHTLGLRLAELAAREAGWRSQWVGRTTPLPDLADVLAARSIQAVAVSASSFSADEDELERQARTLEAMTETAGVPLALGGGGTWPTALSYAKRVRDFDAFRSFLLSSPGHR